MINWSTLIKKLMQTYIVKISGSILNLSTVQFKWHLTPYMTLSIETCIRQTPCFKRTLQHSPRVSAQYRFHCIMKVLCSIIFIIFFKILDYSLRTKNYRTHIDFSKLTCIHFPSTFSMFFLTVAASRNLCTLIC